MSSSRRNSKSLLDRMEEIAEEQEIADYELQDETEQEAELEEVYGEDALEEEGDEDMSENMGDEEALEDLVGNDGEEQEGSMHRSQIFRENAERTETEGSTDPGEVLDVVAPLLTSTYQDSDVLSSAEDLALYIQLYGDGPEVGSSGSFQGSTSSHLSENTSPTSSRRSFSYLRQSNADISLNSAPEPLRDSSLFDITDEDSPENRRRVTITSAGPDNDPTSSLRSSSRRHNPYRQSIIVGTSRQQPDESDDSSRTSIFTTFRKGTVFAPRRSTRRGSTMAPGATGDSSYSMDMAAAVDRLGTQENNTDWENAAAAAAIVAATTQAPAKRGHVQFAQNDYALVLLTLLNITNRDDDKESFTIDPVNAYGYPPGEGKTEAQKQEPFSYVLCTVHNVHFDEDERYYTVRRLDTGTEQRADPGWMEPLKDQAGIDAAYRAAQRTTRSMAEMDYEVTIQDGPCHRCTKALNRAGAWPAYFVRTKLCPWYRRTRAATKLMVRQILLGDMGYALKVQITSINFLVWCSSTYLFLEVISLAFVPAKHDHAIAIALMVVWILLALELIFEVLIRPANYFEIIQSDKAFAPSTARNINRYHVVCETLALLLFIPNFPCVFANNCGEDIPFSNIWASRLAVTSDNGGKAALGRICLGLTFLRAFGLVRHWKQMWLNHTFDAPRVDAGQFIRRILLVEKERGPIASMLLSRKRNDDLELDSTVEDESHSGSLTKSSSEEDQRLKNAATIGTALMLVNSHRALFLLLFIVTIFPALYTAGLQNTVSLEQAELLQENNILSNTTADCDYLQNAVSSWLHSATSIHTSFKYYQNELEKVYILWGRLLPKRCDWQRPDGLITLCDNPEIQACRVWNTTSPQNESMVTPDLFASLLGIREGGISEYYFRETAPADFFPNATEATFVVKLYYNENNSIRHANTSLLILLASMLMLCLVGLTVMRGDAGRLVLDPLRRMLKIVVRYAENPLSQTAGKKQRRINNTANSSDERRTGESAGSGGELGNYETEQLINAITKIADLLRKCWGVAGAGIISSNLARTKDGKTVVFNPTVPGKRVYALFGFVAINDFSKLLRDLDRDVMILINDVARVVHDEVYRWALGDSGQCNKNLGSAFLMVFRIGDFSEVHDKKKRATDVVFNSQMKGNVKVRRRRSGSNRKGSKRGGAARRPSSRPFDIRSDGTLQLASLPGIQSFTDRALLGFLKSFAGIHRDRNLQNWKKDFRLGGGVGAFTVNVIYGMDAGWAVEGAVGSEYKIDATYLSPHVNMASRMMSATKQYGVTILLSQAVEELLSKPAQSKLRHLDTVYVKGSSVAQRIFTYDARYEGVDFFLFERSPEQADVEAEAYNTTIWDVDQDLKSMRQHVTDGFMEKFRKGVDQYLEGKWKAAIETLQDADNIMIQTVLEEGFIDFDPDDYGNQIFDRRSTDDEITRIRTQFGDGACRCLIHYMERRNSVPPSHWHGVRHLMSK